MATPGQLIEAVHRATGVALATVVDLDRKLVKGGLRRKGGRGLNAARMTPLDAARLLTAVLASPQSNTATEAVARYARTRRWKTRPAGRGRSVPVLASLSSLPPDHNFIDALAALLAAMPAGPMTRSLQPQIEISVLNLGTRGRIEITAKTTSFVADYVTPPPATKAGGTRAAGSPAPDRNAGGDLEQSRRITERTIIAVADCLKIDDLASVRDGEEAAD